ncbi:hypothetical protein GGH19_003538 [Coemansia sp. RSA 1807]|nr:hypothetical protein GGH19_003538 [Coemansia sp. RSA 1807]
MDSLRRQRTHGVRLSAKARRWAVILIAVAAIVLFFRICGRLYHSGQGRDDWGANLIAEVDQKYSCASQPLDASVWSARASHGTQPFAIIPAAVRTADRNMLPVVAGQPVCIRVVVPPIKPAGMLARQEKEMVELFQTIPSEPGLWDSITLDAVGQSSGISIPVQLQPVAHANMARRNTVHVYEGELQAYDADVFAISGVVEYRDAAWNYEQPASLPDEYQPERISVLRDAQIRVSVPRASSFHPENHMRLPVCQRTDEPGRWVQPATLPFAAEAHGQPLYGGKVWLPYRCRLRSYTYSAFLQCLDDYRPFSPETTGKYTVHWFGDTNSRRALKKITSLGQWCSGIMASRPQCLCDDSGEAFPRFTGQNTVRDTLLELNDEDGGWSVRENGMVKNRGIQNSLAQVYYHRWEGLTQYNSGRWQDVFKPSALGLYPQANLVVISIGNMDVSFTQFLEYTRQLNELVVLLQSAYDEQHIVLRMPQYFCCRAPSGNPPRRMQKDRNRLYGDYARRLFELHFGSRLHVWDVSGIAETLPLEQRRDVAGCAVNTVPSEIVDLENLQLMNGICNAASLRSKPKPDGWRQDPANIELA